MVIGAAGSIGAAVVRALLPYRPDALDLVDTNENGLVEIVRCCHNEGCPLPSGSSAAALDFTGPEFCRFLGSRRPYDYVLNFAALKHVRSESDPFTAMRMLRVNALEHRAVLGSLKTRPPRRYFVVSSDKAVRPANLLGASKAFMERICLDERCGVPFSSARFANVAFSNGSLLDGFLRRIAMGHPLAGPSDIRRYFISETEAAHLCLLGCFCTGAGTILAPAPGQDLGLKTFPDIAQILLEAFGFEPLHCRSAEEAVTMAQERERTDRLWPCFFAPSTATGEKEFEEFVGPGEVCETNSPPQVTTISDPVRADHATIDDAIRSLEELIANGCWVKSDLTRILSSVVPEFCHRERNASLNDQL